jgi:hypothetical protein
MNAHLAAYAIALLVVLVLCGRALYRWGDQ